MKRILFCLFLFATALFQAQIVNIPDVNFKTKLLQANSNLQTATDSNNNNIKIDLNNDGEIQESEALLVYGLKVPYSNISSATGIEAFENLRKLEIGNNALSSLNVSNLINLNYLACNNNQITSLNLSNLTTLTFLNARSNQLMQLDLSNLALMEYLYCQSNNLTTLSLNSAANYKKIYCGYNAITTLAVNTFNQLIDLYCEYNSLGSLNVTGLSNLENLSCSGNQITALDLSTLFALKNLKCGVNQLSVLDLNGPIALLSLGCQSNLLTSVDLSPLDYIQELLIGNNGLAALDFTVLTSPEELVTLQFCGGVQTSMDVSVFNNLQSVVLLNTNLTSFDISNNIYVENVNALNNPYLDYLNLKNGALGYLSLYLCQNLDFVCADTDKIQMVQSELNSNGLTSTVCNAYCSFTPGGVYNTITGHAQFDADGNGCDVGDSMTRYVGMKLSYNNVPSDSSCYTNTQGIYKYYTQTPGSYQMVPLLEHPSYFFVNPIASNVVFSSINSTVTTQNFCLEANGIKKDLEVVVEPIVPAQPGFNAVYKVVYKNKGNQTMSQLDGVSFSYNPDLMTLVSCSVPFSSQTNGLLKWNFANLEPFESRSIIVELNVNSAAAVNPVAVDDILIFNVNVYPQAGDETVADNSFSYNQKVVSSYNPNDVYCIEGTIAPPSLIGDYLHYVVNFENTGTATVENIVVQLQVNPLQFDINTLQLLESSHDAVIRVKNNIIEIILQSIYLDTGGHGNILLKLQSQETLDVNDSVSKKATIYFGYDAPLSTHVESTIFQNLASEMFVGDKKITIYPNPVSDFINISADETISSLEMYDVQGRLVMVKKIDAEKVSFDVERFSKGIYFIRVVTPKYKYVEKIIIN
ncbi:T9SS type A sorting domain-containing protein [Flavobacterium chuncheonense]|uniref:T9SS type A sorting domain-containing protein n=1 Tax=Flavobacterium chuncheonense TaxID=2026653 RepID=A0ABW5YJ70_9FLAO